MEFSSIIFLVFFALFLISYFMFKNRSYRNIVILLFSLIFYAWGEPIYLFLIITMIVINYYLAILIEKKRSKLTLFIGVAINLLVLIFFKYMDLIITGINLFPKVDLPFLKIALPVGISFFTFQIISYIIDVYRKDVKVQRNILFLGCYIIAFPQLIAGPIVRYETVEDELINRKESVKLFSYGIKRFIVGMAKKVLIANTLGLIATNILGQNASAYGFVGSWVGMICYTLQILFDFSGYSDMAIGIGRMLGFNYLENFDYPYISKSVTEFWRRWHISLGTFFKDYVYIPLGGNRVTKRRLIFNILVVWSLTGLWHGASINFLLWGLYFGVLLLLEKFYLKTILEKLPKLIQHIYLLLIVIFGWVLFRSTSFTEITDIVKSMLGLNGLGNLNLFVYTGAFSIKNIIIFILAILLSTPIFKKIFDNDSVILSLILLVILVISILSIASGSYNPFIYYRF